MADLQALVYVSSAKRLLSADELTHLLECARERNAKEKVTGVLLYSHGKFMQYLEGPEAGLHKVYGLIKTHPLHYALIDLVREPIAAREFAEWSMACHVVGRGSELPLSEHYDLLASRLSHIVNKRSAACLLISHFWAEGRPNDCHAWTPRPGRYHISAEAGYPDAGADAVAPLSMNFRITR